MKLKFSTMIACALLLAGFGWAPARAATMEHRILMSDFRFCPERSFPCDPLDIGYAASPTDPGTALGGQYSPITTITVHPGDVITWVYSEPLCENGVFCPPHDAILGDGTVATPDLKAAGTASYTIPLGTPAGVITFHCKYHAGVGMNGALQVVA